MKWLTSVIANANSMQNKKSRFNMTTIGTWPAFLLLPTFIFDAMYYYFVCSPSSDFTLVIGQFGLCNQELLNLLLTGRAS